jgi:hypothetical protein
METFLIPVFVLACLLLIFVFITLLLYLIPMRFAIRLLRQEDLQEHSVSVSWGLVCFRTIDTANKQRIEGLIGDHIVYTRFGMENQQTAKAVKAPAPPDFRSVADFLPLLPRFIEPAGKFGAVVYHQSAFEGIKGRIRIGTGDPVATGMLYGGFWAARFALMASRIVIDMVPEFERKILEMDLVIRLRINHPLCILIAGIRLYRNPGIRQGMVFLKPPPDGASGS